MSKGIFGIWNFLGAALLCAATAFAAEPDSTASVNAAAPADTTQAAAPAENTAPVQDSLEWSHTLSIIALVLPHNSLHNSKTLHNWPFFAFALPSWTSKVQTKRNFGKWIGLKGLGSMDLGFSGIGFRLDASIELMHLLELGAEPFIGTSINYGGTATFMGVYDPEERDYRQDIIFTNYTYGLKYHAALTLPLLAFLPKTNWTKIMLKGTAELTYSAYTGADDGEVWKAGNSNMVNGFKYRYGGSIIYMLPFKRVPMAMLSGNISGFKHEYDFDPIYKDYNPGYRTISITPMVSIKVSKNWNGMLMAAITRDRVFENREYPTTEELLQKQVDSEWDLRTVMCIFTRKF